MRWLAEEELWRLGTRAEAHTGRPMEMGCLPATRRGWRSRGRLGFQLWERLGFQLWEHLGCQLWFLERL